MSLVSEAVRHALEMVVPHKPLIQIANEVGYSKANVLSMIKHGKTPIPFAKLPLFAQALEIDLGHLMRLYCEDATTEEATALGKSFKDCGFAILSSAEIELVNAMRADTGGQPIAT